MSEKLHLNEDELTGNLSGDLALQLERGQDSQNAMPLTESKKLYEQINPAIDEFMQAVDAHGVGADTIGQLRGLVARLRETDNIQVDTHGGAYFDIGQIVVGKGHWNVEDVALSFGGNAGNAHGEYIREILQKMEVKCDYTQEQYESLAVRRIVWHEMGHALQLAAELTLETEKEGYVVGLNTDRDADEDIGIAGHDRTHITELIEEERLAEGLSILLITDDLVNKGIIEEWQRAEFEKLYRDTWRSWPKYKYVKKLQDDWNSTGRNKESGVFPTDIDEYFEKKYGYEADVLCILGYATFYDGTNTKRILAMTP